MSVVRRLGSTLAVLACIPAALRASAVPTVEDIFRDPRIEGTRPRGESLSPDERWVAFAWNAEGYDAPLDVWLVPATGGVPRALTRFPRDQRADSLRAVHASAVTPTQALTGNKLPRYFEDGTDYRVASIAWAPDSRRVAFVARGDVYVATTGGDVERLTATRSAESDVVWSPDGRHVAFVRDVAAWALEVGRGRELQLTAAGGDSLIPTSLQWSPDGRRIAIVTRDERPQRSLLVPNYLGERVTTGEVKEGYPDQGVRIVDVRWLNDDGGRRDAANPFPVVPVRLGAGRHPLVSAVAWSPDGRRIVFTDITSDMRTRRLLIAAADSGVARAAFTERDSAWIEEYDWVIVDRQVLEWSPNGRSVLFTTERDGFWHLMRVPVEREAAVATGPATALTRGAWEVGWAQWLDDDRVALMGNRGRPSERRLEVLDVRTGALEPLASGDGMSTHPSLGARRKRIVFRRSRFAQPADLWAMEARRGAKPVQLTRSVPAGFQAVSWVVPEIVQFPAKDGVQLHGLLYRPVGFDASRDYPAVVFVHGAGSMQNVVDGWTIYSPNFKFHTVLANAGYVVFEVDYRGSLGYGHDFRAGVAGHMGGKDLDDELAGLDYLAGLGFVDMRRVGIYGGSYGGFMALMGLFTAPDRYACGAALRFVTDWENYYRGNPWYCVQRLGTPDANPLAYWRSSPIHFAANLRKPLLLLHGIRDDNVHFQDAAQLIERLIRLGKRFDLMIYPRESHGFTAAASWIDEYRRIEGFFAEHLRPERAAAGPHESDTRTSPR
jgi:dipeptidyl aminopeptidase/acylaminoacyl peptidase